MFLYDEMNKLKRSKRIGDLFQQYLSMCKYVQCLHEKLTWR